MQQAPILERRRGERVLIRVPIEVRAVTENGSGAMETTETTVISRFGALIRLAKPPALGTTIEIKNLFTQDVEQFRVAWLSEDCKEGAYDVGVEILSPDDRFWGIQFPVKERTA